MQYLISSNVLFEEGDYKLEYKETVIRRYFENGIWGKEEKKLDQATELLYLTTSRVFSLYKTQCLREGDKPLPESTIEYYLKNCQAFVCETKKESFRKIDPKTGTQEVDDNGSKKRTSTTALIFKMAKTGLMIGAKDDSAGVINSNGPGTIQFPTEEVTSNLAF